VVLCRTASKIMPDRILTIDDRFKFRRSCIGTMGRYTTAQIRRGHM